MLVHVIVMWHFFVIIKHNKVVILKQRLIIYKQTLITPTVYVCTFII